MSQNSKVQQFIVNAAHISQVGMLVLLIFGYIYTVRPVYQKEKLEEEVALLNKKIDNLNKEITTSKALIDPLKNEKKQLEKKLLKEKINLENIINLKNEMEQKIKFMEFKYILPDGTPVTTEKQIDKFKKIKNEQNKLHEKQQYFSYLDSLWMSLNFPFNKKQKPFSSSFTFVDSKLDSFPFTKKELEIINSKDGIEEYIKNQIFERFELYNKAKLKELTFSSESDLSKWKKEAKEKINKNILEGQFPEKKQLLELVQKYQEEKTLLLNKLDNTYKSIEVEYADRESWNSYKEALLEHNYETLKHNANIEYQNSLRELDEYYRQLADKIRKDIIKIQEKAFDFKEYESEFRFKLR